MPPHPAPQTRAITNFYFVDSNAGLLVRGQEGCGRVARVCVHERVSEASAHGFKVLWFSGSYNKPQLCERFERSRWGRSETYLAGRVRGSPMGEGGPAGGLCALMY